MIFFIKRHKVDLYNLYLKLVYFYQIFLLFEINIFFNLNIENKTLEAEIFITLFCFLLVSFS